MVRNMDDITQILKEAGAITEGHFIGTSGKHLSVYINKNKILIHVALTSRLCEVLAKKVADWNPDVIVAPATGGIALSQWMAFHMSALLGREVLSAYTESIDGIQSITKRGYDAVVKGKRVVVIEDVVNTGKSINEVVQAVQMVGGEVVGAVALINRNSTDTLIQELLGVPFHSLSLMPLDAYAENEVPESLKKIPINIELGHGAKYLKEHSE